MGTAATPDTSATDRCKRMAALSVVATSIRRRSIRPARAQTETETPTGNLILPQVNIHECYPVTPATVLPDEPGWIDPPTPGLIPLGSCLAQNFAVRPVSVCF